MRKQFSYLHELLEKDEVEVAVEKDDDNLDIEGEALTDETPPKELDELTVATEDLGYLNMLPGMESKAQPPVLNNGMRQGPPPVPLYIRTSGNGRYRIYLRASHIFTSEYINRVCRFLDSRKPDEHVTIYLGCKLDDRQLCIVGATISAILFCACPVKAVVTGYCSVVETMLFCFCKEREMREYGVLSFGGTSILKDFPMYEGFFRTMYERVLELGYLTQEEIDRLWKYSEEKLLYADEFNGKNAE